MVGKYTGLSDAYLSVLKALQHACLSASRKLEVLWVEASHLEPTSEVPSLVSARHLRGTLHLQDCPHIACSYVTFQEGHPPILHCIGIGAGRTHWQALLSDDVHLKCVCSHVQRHTRTRLSKM